MRIYSHVRKNLKSSRILFSILEISISIGGINRARKHTLSHRAFETASRRSRLTCQGVCSSNCLLCHQPRHVLFRNLGIHVSLPSTKIGKCSHHTCMMNYDDLFKLISQERVKKQHIIQIWLHVSADVSEYERFYISNIRSLISPRKNPQFHIGV